MENHVYALLTPNYLRNAIKVLSEYNGPGTMLYILYSLYPFNLKCQLLPKAETLNLNASFRLISLVAH